MNINCEGTGVCVNSSFSSPSLRERVLQHALRTMFLYRRYGSSLLIPARARIQIDVRCHVLRVLSFFYLGCFCHRHLTDMIIAEFMR